MDSYPNNSRSTREEAGNTPDQPQKVDKVISGNVVRRKKTLGRRFLEVFIGDSTGGGVWNYILEDVIVPMTKDMVTDAITGGVERAVYGDVRGRSGGSRVSRGVASRTDYSGISSRGSLSHRRDEPRREISRRGRETHDFDEIILGEKAEALEVLDIMYDNLDRYKTVTVATLYGLVGIQSSHVDQAWGWDDLGGADVQRIKGGSYLLNLPRPEPLN